MSEIASRILLVDDERHLLVSLKDYLVSEQFDVVTASSGEEALEKLDATCPDLIVLDISMPGMGGLGFLKQISGSDGKTRYPVLVLTARSMLEHFFDSVSVAGFLTKPCDEAKLVRTIRKIISVNQKKPLRDLGQKFTVLLGEDDPAVVRSITAVFSPAGFVVTHVETGPDVLERAIQAKPDVILLKEVLPRLNGAAVAGLIDVMPSLSAIPVIIYGDRISGGRESMPPVSAKCVRQQLSSSRSDILLDAVQAVQL